MYLIGFKYLYCSSFTKQSCLPLSLHQGDSGAPLVCQKNGVYYLFGVMTWGSRRCDPSKPAVFSSIADVQLWLTETTDDILWINTRLEHVQCVSVSIYLIETPFYQRRVVNSDAFESDLGDRTHNVWLKPRHYPDTTDRCECTFLCDSASFE